MRDARHLGHAFSHLGVVRNPRLGDTIIIHGRHIIHGHMGVGPKDRVDEFSPKARAYGKRRDQGKDR